MAIDYGNYAAQYGGQSQGFDQLNQGIQAAIEGNKERRQMQAMRLNDDIWNNIILKPFENASYGNVDTWGAMSFDMNAGSAFRKYKEEALKNPKIYNILSQAGMLDPLAFKQKYDEMAAQYAPLINKKLEFYADQKGWSTRQLQQYITNTGNTGLQEFLLDHSAPGTLAYESGKEYKNLGLFPGALDAALVHHPMAWMGPAFGGGSAGIRELYRQYKGKAWDKGKLGRAVAGGANPLNMGTTPAFKKLGSKELSGLASKLKGTGFADKNMKAKILRNMQGLQAEKGLMNRTLKKARQTPGWTDKKFTFKGKEYTGKGLLKKQKLIDSRFIKNEKAMTKAPLATLKKYIRKNGTMSLVKLIGKRIGYGKAAWMAAKLAAGSALSLSGLGTAVGVGINMYTLYDIARVVGKALKETGGPQRPDKMLFGV